MKTVIALASGSSGMSTEPNKSLEPQLQQSRFFSFIPTPKDAKIEETLAFVIYHTAHSPASSLTFRSSLVTVAGLSKQILKRCKSNTP